MHDLVFESAVVFNCAYVVIEGFNLGVWINVLQRLLGCLDLGEALVRRQIKHPVHVGELNFVVVVKDKFADATPSQHLGDDGANAADTHDDHGEGADFFVVSDDAHSLEGHQSRVGVGIFDLSGHCAARVRRCFHLFISSTINFCV